MIADPNLSHAVEGATLLIFVLPHQFLGRICPQMTAMAKGCRAISLIKVVYNPTPPLPLSMCFRPLKPRVPSLDRPRPPHLASPRLATLAASLPFSRTLTSRSFRRRPCPPHATPRHPTPTIASPLRRAQGIEFENGGPVLISNMIKEAMSGMDVSVLMGANVANEVAQDQFCESTVGYKSKARAPLLVRVRVGVSPRSTRHRRHAARAACGSARPSQ